jgi:hypothetical protein
METMREAVSKLSTVVRVLKNIIPPKKIPLPNSKGIIIIN